MIKWGTRLLLAASSAVCCAGIALAAPDRFDNQIPDAVPDPENSYNISFSLLSIDTDGPITSERSSNQFLKLGYQFSEKLHASFRINNHDLAGGIGLSNPLFSNLDSARSYGLRLEMNLLNEPAKEAGPDNQPPWTPGSAFMIGFEGKQYELDRSGIGENESELGAFLAYSTDLTEEMRGHTYFSSARLTGDNASGSLNRVGAGLDYLVQDGERPLILMANGLIDIYNFRQPSFNTSRISRFDLGLRYKMSRQWDAQLGWSTFNDSEQDSSGSGMFAGINWRGIKKPCHCGECENCSNQIIREEPKPAEGGEQPPAQASADPAVVAAASNLHWDPADTPMMELDYPEGYDSREVERALQGGAAEVDNGADRILASAQPQDEPGTASSGPMPEDAQGGIDIPLFPEQEPHMTASAELMVRPRSTSGVEPIARDSILNVLVDEESVDNEQLTEQLPAEPEALPVVEIDDPAAQGFVPQPTSGNAVLSRAPAPELVAAEQSDGITDACSRILFLRIAALPKRLLARGD